MNKENVIRKFKNFKSDSIATALPYVIDMLPEIFVNGLCVSLPAIGNVCLNFKQNSDTRKLTEKVDRQGDDLYTLREKVERLCDAQKKQVYEQLKCICENEIVHLNDESSNDIYRVDYMELILDEAFEYDFSCFNTLIENLENPYIVSDSGYVWITGNKITINIDGYVTRYSCEFHDIIEYVNELLWDVGISSIKYPIKSVKCF